MLPQHTAAPRRMRAGRASPPAPLRIGRHLSSRDEVCLSQRHCRIPNFVPENATQPTYAKSCNVLNLPMQVAVCKLRVKEMIVVFVAVRIVIAVDVPDRRLLSDRRKFNVQRPLGLQVTQQHDGLRLHDGNCFKHRLEVAMWIPKKENLWAVLRRAQGRRQIRTRKPLLTGAGLWQLRRPPRQVQPFSVLPDWPVLDRSSAARRFSSGTNR